MVETHNINSRQNTRSTGPTSFYFALFAMVISMLVASFDGHGLSDFTRHVLGTIGGGLGFLTFVLIGFDLIRRKYLRRLKQFQTSSTAYLCMQEWGQTYLILSIGAQDVELWNIDKKKPVLLKRWPKASIHSEKTVVQVSQGWCSNGFSLQSTNGEAARYILISTRPGIVGALSPAVGGETLDAVIAQLNGASVAVPAPQTPVPPPATTSTVA